MMNSDVNTLRKAIVALLEAHQARPFGILREVGVQAKLKSLADQFLNGRTSVMASIAENHLVMSDSLVETDRVRLEGKIHLPAELEGENDVTRSRTDLFLYREKNVRLFRHPSGYGDIVYKTMPEDVLAAVEIKASPSSQLSQRISYAKDIIRLLNLRSRGIAGFFILLDKSSDIYAQINDPVFPAARVAFPLNKEPSSLGTVIGVNDALWENILISTVMPSEAVDFVEIWNISATVDQPRQFFAYRGVVA